MGDAVRFLEVLIPVLWVALAVAIAVFVVASLSVVLGPVVRWIEIRALPRVTRRARAHHGLRPDAQSWACEACGSVNVPTAAACYHCRTPRPTDARELGDAATDPDIFHPPAPVDVFDPSRYRGPGAPPPAEPDPTEPPSRIEPG